MLISPRMLRIVVAIANEKIADYVEGEGAMCPLCQTFGHAVVRAPVVSGACPVRYHRCPICSHRFKSIEKEISENPPSKTQGFVDEKPKKRHIRNRKG